MKCLETCLGFDSYLKYIDLSHNKVKSFTDFVESQVLIQNDSILNFDVRHNPGIKDDVKKRIALSLLRNIASMK